MRQLKDSNINEFKNILTQTDLADVLINEDTDDAYNCFLQEYSSLFDRACPIKYIRATSKYIKREPLITNGLMISIINKSKLYRKKINKPNEHNVNMYKVYCNIFNKHKITAKAKYYTDMLYLHKHNIKETMDVLRQVMNKSKQSVKHPKTFIVNGIELSNSKRIAEELNTFLFLRSVPKISNSIPETNQIFSDYLKGNYKTIFFMHPTDIQEVTLKLVTHKLKNKKTTSCYNLSTFIIQKTIDEIAIPITHIINQSLASGLVPDKLKISKIIPIFKSGNNEHFNNYRPISILPPISKILEKIVCNRLIHFFRQI